MTVQEQNESARHEHPSPSYVALTHGCREDSANKTQSLCSDGGSRVLLNSQQ